jgi:RNA polymerase sigma-70 factor (sigma-E family)
VEAAEARDERFREFVAARSAALLRLAYLVCGDHSKAEDLLQATLTRTYLALRRLDGIDSLDAYSRRVLVNTATSWWRRRWRGEYPTELLPEQPVRDQTDRIVERDAIWRLLGALPARQRAVIVLRYYEDMSEAEIANTLGLSLGSVKSHASRGLASLRLRLSADPHTRRLGPMEPAEEAS